MISAILWDVDGTLLDFNAAESAAIKSLFSEFSLGDCTDEMVARYSQINDSYWKRLEKKEITRQQVLIGRFEEFFAEQRIDTSLAQEFSQKYQQRLGELVAYRDDSLSIVTQLRGHVKQYVVSNGTTEAQTNKLRRSGLGAQMDGIFLSEALGVDKPNTAFFEKVFDIIGPISKSEVLIIGDSLTSDILGGINAGIHTCWYNPSNKPIPEVPIPDYVITDLHEIIHLLQHI